MDQREFSAAQSRRFQEIELQTLAPRPGKGRHRHHFAIRGMVLSGTFLVTQNSDPVTYGAGQVFAVDLANCTIKSIGADGAIVLVGRKFADQKPFAGSQS